MKQTDLAELIRGMDPRLNPGEYVFVTVQDLTGIERGQALCEFREAEGTTLVLERRKADELKLNYEFIASWITLQVHSSLEAVGLTAACSGELAKHRISCNVMAGYYHDHIFVNRTDAPRAIQVLRELSEKQR
jgi:hypothetical protein